MKKKVQPHECQCRRCEYVWWARVADPVACPACKSVYWKTPARAYIRRKKKAS